MVIWNVVGGVFWSLVHIGMHVGLSLNKLTNIGYNYQAVVQNKEWWRLAVAPLCHRERQYCFLVVLGTMYSSLLAPREECFAVVSILLVIASELVTLSIIGAFVSSGVPATEFASAHGSGTVALAWISLRRHHIRRPAVVALLFVFSQGLAAPHEPIVPLIAASFVGLVISRFPGIFSPYWTITTLLWLLFFVAASLKATTERYVPGIDYSHLGGGSEGPSPGDLEAPPPPPRRGRGSSREEENYGDDGGPLFRIALRLDRRRDRFTAALSSILVTRQRDRDVVAPPAVPVVPATPGGGGDPFFVPDLDDDDFMIRRHLLRGDPDDFPSPY